MMETKWVRRMGDDAIQVYLRCKCGATVMVTDREVLAYAGAKSVKARHDAACRAGRR